MPVLEMSRTPGRNAWTYKGCKVVPVRLNEATLVGCNNHENRYLRDVWRIDFPDETWVRVGTKDEARWYIDRGGRGLP